MLNNSPISDASGLSCLTGPTPSQEQRECTLTRERQKLRDLWQNLRHDASAQKKEEYKNKLQKIFMLVEQCAEQAPERMAPMAANMARHAIHNPDIQESFAKLWKKLVTEQVVTGKEGTLTEEARRQIELFHQAEEQMGVLRDPANEPPFVRVAQSLVKQPASVISLSSKRPPSCTSNAHALARRAL